ncbi:hypothetical protein [Peribacillus frigoritolerans]|uniref:hypothetical protein n=1 Tax=Peribacillus frigoritolerans TaxID=450367 RepID=UPI003F7CFE29
MMYIKKSPNSFGFVNPRDIEQMWLDQFDWVYEHMDYAVFPMTIHPDVSGRPQVLQMHERIIQHINGYKDIRWVTFMKWPMILLTVNQVKMIHYLNSLVLSPTGRQSKKRA